MTDLRDRLRRADPVTGESPLSTADVQRMRYVVLGAVVESRPVLAGWRRTAWTLAAIAAVIVIAGIDRWLQPVPPAAGDRPATPVDTELAQTSSLRQMQFQTRGGTRVIWIFNPDFQP